MDSGLYIVSTTCPICEKDFNVLKVKTSAVKLEGIDEDFCMHYKDLNPLLYEPWVCEYCGYTGYESSFTNLLPWEIAALQKLCLMKYIDDDDPSRNPFELSEYQKKVYRYKELKTLSSEGERNNLTALLAFETLSMASEVRNAPDSLKAKTFLRLGWIYRFLDDPLEMKFLKKAADCFASAYQSETFPIGKFDDASCAYLTGELYRRTGSLKEAMQWFERVLRLPKSTQSAKTLERTRDQIQLIKNSPEYAKLK